MTIIGGLQPEKYSALDNVLLFAGLSSYVGETWGCQDKLGNVISKFNKTDYSVLLLKVVD